MHTLPTALFVWALFPIGFVHGQGSAALAFNWITPSTMATCQPATVTWLYNTAIGSADTEMAISITNLGVLQAPAPSSTTVGTFSSSIHDARGVSRGSRVFFRRDDITQSITTTFINPATRAFTWPSVNVSSGWYILLATFPDSSSIRDSDPFYVVEGSNTACLSASPSGSTTGSPTSSPTSALTGTQTSSGDSSSSSGAILPVSDSSSSVNRGAIAGGVIGGLAVIAAAVAAYFYLRYASASSRTTKKRTRKWTGLTSTDSKAPSYPSTGPSATGTSGRHHSQSDSIGPMISHDSNVYVIGNVGIDSRTSRMTAGLDDDYGADSYLSPSQEKISHGSPIRSPFTDSGDGHLDADGDAVPLDLISPLPGNNLARNSSTSTASHMTNSSRNFSRPRSHPSSPYASPTTADAPYSTTQNNNTNSSLSHPDSPSSSYPPNPSPAFPSGTSQAAAEAVVGASSSRAARRGSIGEPVGARRVARKAVPQYNPNDPALVSPPPPAAPALPVVQQAQDSDSSRESSLRAGRTGMQDSAPLSHKASFGEGRPVHYLIPDMPPPQRD